MAQAVEVWLVLPKAVYLYMYMYMYMPNTYAVIIYICYMYMLRYIYIWIYSLKCYKQKAATSGTIQSLFHHDVFDVWFAPGSDLDTPNIFCRSLFWLKNTLHTVWILYMFTIIIIVVYLYYYIYIYTYTYIPMYIYIYTYPTSMIHVHTHIHISWERQFVVPGL